MNGELVVSLLGRKVIREPFVLTATLEEPQFDDGLGPVYDCPLCDEPNFVIQNGHFFCFACAASGIAEEACAA